jgi:Na+/H+ antiporter NhaC
MVKQVFGFCCEEWLSFNWYGVKEGIFLICSTILVILIDTAAIYRNEAATWTFIRSIDVDQVA